MKEEFLHYLWKYSLYQKDKLLDSDGNQIQVIHPGTYNRDAGPDFFNARIKIAGTTWAGNVEIHLKSSHFNLHGHDKDPSYDNLILHVVIDDDREIFNTKGIRIPAAILHFKGVLYDRYLTLVNNPFIIACQEHLAETDPLLINQWLTALSVERLESKSDAIRKILADTGNDWEEVFYRMLCRYFGFRVNAEPFEMLASTLPFRIIRKHSDNIFQIEALLFGAAGMLDEGLFRQAIGDDYYSHLIKEFKILSAKYSIKPLHGWIWKFSRLRPINFPTIRISQLSSMLAVAGGLFSRIRECEDTGSVKALLEAPASEYWNDHFIFGKKAGVIFKNTGSQATDILLINAVIPVMFMYGKERGRQDILEKALAFLEEATPEENLITSEWKKAGIKASSALYSQALLCLRNEYCRKRRCLDCRIGNELISKGRKLRADEELILEP